MSISLTLSSSASYNNPFPLFAQSLTIFYNYHAVLKNIHHLFFMENTLLPDNSDSFPEAQVQDLICADKKPEVILERLE